ETLMPQGIPATPLLATVSLPEEDAPDAPAYAGVHELRFVLENGPPRITALNWNAGAAHLGVEPSSASTPLTTVACELDGAPVGCWGTAGGTWQPAGLAAGAHTLTVRVHDAAGNFTSEQLTFTVPQAEQPGTGQPGQPGTGQPAPVVPAPSTGDPDDADAPDDAAPGDTDAGSGEGGGNSDGGAPDGDAPDDDAAASGDDPATDDRDGVPAGPDALIWILLALGLVLVLVAAVVVTLLRRRP